MLGKLCATNLHACALELFTVNSSSLRVHKGAVGLCTINHDPDFKCTRLSFDAPLEPEEDLEFFAGCGLHEACGHFGLAVIVGVPIFLEWLPVNMHSDREAGDSFENSHGVVTQRRCGGQRIDVK